MLRSQRRRESKCQEARRTRLQETAASDVPLGTTVRDVVLLPWYSDHNFPYSLQGLLENSEMGAQGEMAHFYPSCHLCSHRWERRDEDGEEEGMPATTRRGEAGGRSGTKRRTPTPAPQDQVVSFQFTLTLYLILVSRDRLVRIQVWPRYLNKLLILK